MIFRFKNRTIRKVHASFKDLLGCNYELNNGETVTTIGISDLHEIIFECEDFRSLTQLPDTTLIFGKDQISMYGFEIQVKKDLGNGRCETWIEKICVPYRMRHRKNTVENNYKESLIHS